MRHSFSTSWKYSGTSPQRSHLHDWRSACYLDGYSKQEGKRMISSQNLSVGYVSKGNSPIQIGVPSIGDQIIDRHVGGTNPIGKNQRHSLMVASLNTSG